MKKIIDIIIKEAKWIDKMAIDFSSQEALDAYMKKHPLADKSNHKVVDNIKTNMSPEDEAIMQDRQELQNKLNRHKTDLASIGWYSDLAKSNSHQKNHPVVRKIMNILNDNEKTSIAKFRRLKHELNYINEKWTEPLKEHISKIESKELPRSTIPSFLNKLKESIQ